MHHNQWRSQVLRTYRNGSVKQFIVFRAFPVVASVKALCHVPCLSASCSAANRRCLATYRPGHDPLQRRFDPSSPKFWQFLRHNKKWWPAPIIATLLLVAVLISLAESSGAGPLMDTLF